MSKYTNLYLPLSNQNLYFVKKQELYQCQWARIQSRRSQNWRKERSTDRSMRFDFWKQRLHWPLRQPGDRHDDNRRVIEFCNWASRGLEHADLSIFEDETIDEQITVVKSHLYLGMPIMEVSSKFNVDISVARLYIKRFKKALKKRNKSNIKYLGKSKILKVDHQNTLRKLIDNQINHILTLNDMKKELLRQHSELQNVSTSTISR